MEWIKKHQHLFSPGTLITDVTGIKSSVVYEVQDILREAEGLRYSYEWSPDFGDLPHRVSLEVHPIDHTQEDNPPSPAHPPLSPNAAFTSYSYTYALPLLLLCLPLAWWSVRQPKRCLLVVWGAALVIAGTSLWCRAAIDAELDAVGRPELVRIVSRSSLFAKGSGGGYDIAVVYADRPDEAVTLFWTPFGMQAR